MEKFLIGVFYLSLLVFILFPLITGKYWDKDETIERNINKLMKKIVFWFAFFCTCIISLVILSIVYL